MGIDLHTFLQIIVFGLVAGGLYALAASGLSLIYGVMQILNIAHGEFLMIGAYIMFWLFTLADISPLWSMLVTAPMMFVLGLLVFKVVVTPLQRVVSVHLVERSTLIAFFGILILVQNSALVMWSADYRVVTYLQKPLRFLFLDISVNRLVVLVISVVVILLLEFFLTRTYAGKAIRAITQDREAAMLMAIDADKLSMLCFGLGTALAGIAGSLGGVLNVITPHMGFPFLIKAFVIMIIGGLGNMLGCLYAGFLLGVVEFVGAYFVGEAYRSAIDYFILVTFLLLASRGYIRKFRGAI
ncbi:MAG: branched-chain amino acid ABC transporter permease [Desulfobacteraceae bacterium]|jgi:branched-chain amino acid transport system permease protein|nr:MAG: branched-chain amino acid ABC transporter permease [Desulfobacteraceae bacterium]